MGSCAYKTTATLHAYIDFASSMNVWNTKFSIIVESIESGNILEKNITVGGLLVNTGKANTWGRTFGDFNPGEVMPAPLGPEPIFLGHYNCF